MTDISTIRVHDKEFAPSIPAEEIMRQVRRVAKEIDRDYDGEAPVFLVVLNGAFVFAADLMREVSLQAEVSFVKLASYEGTSSTGTVREVIGLNTDITGRPVIIVEDIVESGITMAHMIATLKKQNRSSRKSSEIPHWSNNRLDPKKSKKSVGSVPYDQRIIGTLPSGKHTHFPGSRTEEKSQNLGGFL